MIIERPVVNQEYLADRLAVLDVEVRECRAESVSNVRAAKLLPDLALSRLYHLLACVPPNWHYVENAAFEILDAYEMLIDLVQSRRGFEDSGKGTGVAGFVDRIELGRTRRASMTVSDFFAAFWTAVVLGDSRRLRLLAEAPREVFVTSGVEVDEFLFKWMETLQCYRRKDRRWVQLLADSIYLSDPARVEVASDDSLHYVLYPPIKLFYTLAAGTEAEFNFELEDALVRHHYYWTSESGRESVPQGWASLPLTAISCMALNKGYRIVPESLYLPLKMGLEGA
ncbi:immunity 49 family protein [Nocardia asteroides]|uniref:immunity 49 family protein n=1 Tax=Nocardia asteroides TaxID=1824 RepID=UPI001E58B055|nr:immunity 49 family protein [Nocardia asteroides]UGT52384.1 immunity 49 family protein [Nocardia asteroides]